MAESKRESGDSWKRDGTMVKVSSLSPQMRLNMLMEQGQQHSLFQGLQTLRLATIHDHQEGCL